MTQPRIVLVGGGSLAWTPGIVRDMLLTPSLSKATYVLYDIDKAAADLTATYLRKLAGQLGIKARIVPTNQRAQAFRGADYFIITISTGGLDAMVKDIAIPEKFGIYHTVGDTSGPGGWARLIRNFDVFVGLANDFNRYAPGAVVLNYTNPMCTLTDVLCRLCKGPVVGLCHGLFENLAFLKNFYKAKSEEQIAVQYAGLNHFFWITQAYAGGVDVLADLARRLLDKDQSFTDLLAEARPDAMGFKSNREVATELFRITGVMPYLGDRHTCEFFSCYLSNPQTMRRYKLVRTTVAERKAALRRRRENLRQLIKSKQLPASCEKRSRETAADIIDAHVDGKVFIDVGNVPNQGQIANLPRNVVVETAVRVDRNGFTPISFGALPAVVQGMITPYAQLYPMTVEACFRGDRRLAMQALRLDPVCAHLSGARVQALGEKLLGAHQSFIKAF